MGLEVLGDILTECHFLSTHLTYKNPEQIGENRVGTLILAKMGTLNQNSMREVLKAFTGIIPDENL